VSFVTLSCEGCGAQLAQPATGRPRRTCSDACRQRAYRRRQFPPPLPVGLVQNRLERGGFVSCELCPQLWTWANTRAEGLWLREKHVRKEHPGDRR
jgi:hypothetical protein